MDIDPTESDHAQPCNFHPGAPAQACEQCDEELEDYFEYLDAGEDRGEL